MRRRVRRPRREGVTILEVCIAGAIAVMVLGVVIRLLVSGSKLFKKGIAAARGPEVALLMVDRFEQDLSQCLQAPGDPRPPAKVMEGTRLTYYRPVREMASGARVVGAPASWDLQETAPDSGVYNAVRDGEVLRHVLLEGWRIQLIEPDAGNEVPGWFVHLEARFPIDGAPTYTVSRLIHLPQPSSNFLHFLGHGQDMIPGLVQMIEPPKDDPSFAGLGPPAEGLGIPAPPPREVEPAEGLQNEGGAAGRASPSPGEGATP